MEYEKAEISDFLQKLIQDGYDVEEEVHKIFPTGVDLGNKQDEILLEETQDELKKKGTIFQATFKYKEKFVFEGRCFSV